MAKKIAQIDGLKNVLPVIEKKSGDVVEFEYYNPNNESNRNPIIDHNTVCFVKATSDDIERKILINGVFYPINENDKYIIHQKDVYNLSVIGGGSGSEGGSGGEGSTCNCGYRTVQTSSELNSIDSCEVGTVVYVIDEDKFYKYDGTDFSVIDLGGTHMLPAEVYATISIEGGVPSITSTYGFDDIKTPGVYFLGAGYNQSPGTLYVISTTSENDYVVQSYTNLVAYSNYTFSRQYTGSSWSEWICSYNGNEYTGGTNIDITDNVISAKGYVFDKLSISFAEGSSTTASGYTSHAEGFQTTASGAISHAEGSDTIASGAVSHAEGNGTVATNTAEHAEGKYNVSNKTVLNNGHEYIDLVLPSGLLWATQNVGAETPQDSGLYFDWGNVDGHAVDESGNVEDGYPFDETTYAETPGGQFTGSTLDAEHDAAKANMGGCWRMPTTTEIDELVENTDHYYIDVDGNIVAGPFDYGTNIEDKGLDGSTLRSICFVKKGDPFDYNNRSNFIEFPFAGDCVDSLLGSEGSVGNVWSSSVFEHGTDYARYLGFFSAGSLRGDISRSRYVGQSVRGVISKESVVETISSIGIGTSETDRKNAFEVTQNGDIYIYGIGDYNGKYLENVGSVQAVISNLQESMGGVVENQITYSGSNNINISNGTISALGYSFDNILNKMNIVDAEVRGSLVVDQEFISNGFSTFCNNIVLKGSNDTTSATINAYNGNITTIGTISAANGFYETSDIRKKNVIDELPLDKAYELINNCQSIIYTLKDNTDKQQIGLIAQEVREFFPEIVEEDKDGYLSLDYSRLTVVLLRVLKDLIDRVSKLEK